jgi:hypothetical protein
MLNEDRSSKPATQGETTPRDTRREGAVLACVACKKPVTNRSARLEVNGSHEHHFVNPDGERFQIGCFSRAFGCATMGVPTLEYTWFPGYAWQFETCGGCGGPMGWLYQSKRHLFHGLMLNRLIELH